VTDGQQNRRVSPEETDLSGRVATLRRGKERAAMGSGKWWKGATPWRAHRRQTRGADSKLGASGTGAHADTRGGRGERGRERKRTNAHQQEAKEAGEQRRIRPSEGYVGQETGARGREGRD